MFAMNNNNNNRTFNELFYYYYYRVIVFLKDLHFFTAEHKNFFSALANNNFRGKTL